MRSLSVFFKFAVALGTLWFPLAAAARPVEFDIPAQPLDRALLLLSRQAKVELLFSPNSVREIESIAVAGSFEPAKALERMLGGTGFVARQNFLGKFVVVAAPPPPGTLRGRIVLADGLPARGVRVSLREIRKTTLTNADGEFEITAVPPAAYHVIASGSGYPTMLVAAEARVESNRVLTLDPQTIRTGSELMRLDPVVVEGRADRSGRFTDDEAAGVIQRAAGNLNVPRTRNDALPYNMFTREQISRSGMVNLNDFLQRTVLDSDAVTRPTEQKPMVENLENFGAGSANLKLRGYGADETVVLVNGRRLPEALISGPNAQPQTPDVNFIPLSLVERVEVLPIAASALYSGNAVGGVINIVLRPELDATEVTTTYTNALSGFDAPQSTISLQHGETLLSGALRVRFNATFTRTEPVNESELGYIGANLRHRGGMVDGLHRATPNIASADGFPLFNGGGMASFTSVAPGADGSGGLAALTARAGVRSTALFDFAGGTGNSPDSRDFPYGRQQEGHSYFGSVTYDATPWLQIGFDGIVTANVLHRGDAVFPGDLTLRSDSPLNPFGRDLNVTLNETAPQLGANYNEAQVDFSSAVLGMLIRLPREWRVSLDAQYGHSLTRYRGVAGVDGTRWQELVDEGIYNPLRDTQVFAPPAAFYDRALIYYGGRGGFVTLGNYDTLDAAFRVSNRSLPFPTGNATLNFGGDYRRNQLDAFTNERRYGDGSLVEEPGAWSGRTLERLSAFGEIQTPLVPRAWLPKGIHGVEIDVAARYIAAATAQETNVAPTGAVKIDLAGGFSLRGTIATSNRFPPPVLNRRVQAPDNTGTGGGEVTLGTIRDPLRGNARYGVTSTEELNPDLRLEAAVSRTFGVIFQHGKIHRVRAAVDFMDTRKSGELHFLDVQETVDVEKLFPGRVQRAAPAAGDPNPAGLITSILTGTVNLAWRHSQSWSTSLDYAWTECFGGRFQSYARWIYFERYDVQLLPNSPVVNELSHPDQSNPGLMRHRLNFGAEWSNADFGFGVDGHYFHSRVLPVNDWFDQGRDRIRPHWQFDSFVQTDLGRWLLPKSSRFGLRAQVRVNNVLNTPPPKYVNDSSQTGVQVYGDWRGRVYSVSLTANF